MRLLATLAVACIGGFLLSLSHIPLAWLLGSMLAVGICSQFIQTLSMPESLRHGGTAVLGTIVGTLVTINTLQLITTYAPTIIIMLLSQIVLVMLGTWFISHKTKTDRLSALLAAYPGSISQITAISLENQCNTHIIAMNHTFRLFLVITSIPLVIFALSGNTNISEMIIKDNHEYTLMSYIWPLIVAFVGYDIGKRCRIMTPSLFGPMILAALLNIFELLPKIAIGEWLIYTAQVIIGASVGLRLKGLRHQQWQQIKSVHLFYGLGLLIFTLIVSLLTHLILDVPLLTSLLLMAPGGLSEIVLVAIALDIDPVMVTAHHVTRSLFGFLAIPFAIQIWAKKKPTIYDT